jgi:serine/threonine-protein kinase
MEVIEGRSLKELIMTHGALPVHTAIGYAKQLLEALRFAHRHGIIHRDIKPHNVLVSADQQVKANEPRLKVTDFGIARHGASQMTEAGSIMGTAQYLSPEQARGAPVTAASDLYSAGVVLYEMLTGKVPFTGDSAIEIAMKHVNELPKPPSSLRPEIPPELDQIVLRALAKDPEDRYQTAEEFIEDLERVEAGLPISRSTATAATAILAGAAVGESTELLSETPTRVAAPPAPPPQRRPPTYPPSSPYDEPPRKRKRWVPWLLVALLLAAAILAGWWVYNQIQDQLEAAEPVGVPNVVGLERDLAIQQIEDAELEASVEEQPSTEVQQGIVIEQSPPAGSRIAKGDTVTIVVSTGPREVEVPALAGRTYEEAVDILEELGLEPERVDVFSQRPPGIVASLDPKAGTLVDEGSVVTVRVSKGTQLIPVPDVLEQSEDSARAELEAAGFQVEVVEAPSSSTPAGLVSAQSPDPGVEAARGSTVQITISTGPEQVRVPAVEGMSEGDAQDALDAEGLVAEVECVVVVDPGQVGIVQDTDPEANTLVEVGSTVIVKVGQAAC